MGLYAALFPAGFRMTADTFEYQVGKKGDGCGVDNPQALHPRRFPPVPAVRRKTVTVLGVQIAVNGFKDRLGTSAVGIGQRAAGRHHGYAQTFQLQGFTLQGGHDLTQGVKAHDYGIEHHNQVSPAVEAFHIMFTAVLTA